MTHRRPLAAGLLGVLLAVLVFGWSRRAGEELQAVSPAKKLRADERGTARSSAAPPGETGPIVRKVGNHIFADGARLGAPPFAFVDAIRADHEARFGAGPGRSDPDEEAAREELFLVARNLAWVRDWSAIEDPSYDSAANQGIQLRVQVVIERGGGIEEMAYAVEGARAECQAGLGLKEDAGRRAAEDCLEMLPSFERP